MHRLIRYTEQLQLAGAFLHEKGQQYARLALILCDNVVELLGHEQCEMYLLKEAKGWSITKLSKAERADARGQEFAPKVNLLVKLKDVTEEQRDFATRAHTQRVLSRGRNAPRDCMAGCLGVSRACLHAV